MCFCTTIFYLFFQEENLFVVLWYYCKVFYIFFCIVKHRMGRTFWTIVYLASLSSLLFAITNETCRTFQHYKDFAVVFVCMVTTSAVWRKDSLADSVVGVQVCSVKHIAFATFKLFYLFFRYVVKVYYHLLLFLTLVSNSFHKFLYSFFVCKEAV